MKDVERDYTVNGRRSLGHVSRRIRLHLLPAFGGRRRVTIEDSDIRTYITDRLTAGAKPASVNRELAIVKRAFNAVEAAAADDPETRGAERADGVL